MEAESKIYFSGATHIAPVSLTYTNIQDGGSYRALPSGADVNGGNTNIGFTGAATLYGYGYPVTRIYLWLQQPNGQYWNGSARINQRTRFDASYRVVDQNTGRVVWSKIGGWPSGADLPSGGYTLRTMALSNAAGRDNTIFFTIDNTPPKPSSLTNPTPGSTVSALNGLTGTYGDNAGGSGIARVGIQLVRTDVSPLVSWNWNTRSWGPDDGSAPMVATATLQSATTWAINSAALPTSVQMPNGTYQVQMPTWDKAGNYTFSSAPFSFAAASDTTAPNASTLTSPVPGSMVSSLTSLAGTYGDNPGGSGVNRVGIQLVRTDVSPRQSWNWTTHSWGPDDGSAPMVKTASLVSATNWSVTTDLLTSAQIPNGTYQVQMPTWGKAGNFSFSGAGFALSRVVAFTSSSTPSSSSS